MGAQPGSYITPTVRLIERIGSGGMGEVWLAEHAGLDAEVAVKLVHDRTRKRERNLKRFKREASIAAKIRSPHVVEIFDFGITDDGIPYMVMERLRGESLKACIVRRGVLSRRKVALLVTQVAKALSAAHALHTVHRDLKPDNVFLLDTRYELFAKLLDFGIAKPPEDLAQHRLTKTGTMVGTPFYMSPEQLRDAKNVDHRADLWALAVIAYYALCGQLPFSGKTIPSLAMAVCTGRFQPVSFHLDEPAPELDVWFKLAFCRQIEGRFDDARTMAAAFSAALEGSLDDPGVSARAPENALFLDDMPAGAQAWPTEPEHERALPPAAESDLSHLRGVDAEPIDMTETPSPEAIRHVLTPAALRPDGVGTQGARAAMPSDAQKSVGLRPGRAMVAVALFLSMLAIAFVARRRAGSSDRVEPKRNGVTATASAVERTRTPTASPSGVPATTSAAPSATQVEATPSLSATNRSSSTPPEPGVRSVDSVTAPPVSSAPSVDCSDPYLRAPDGHLRLKPGCVR